jgi:hypothetical protein
VRGADASRTSPVSGFAANVLLFRVPSARASRGSAETAMLATRISGCAARALKNFVEREARQVGGGCVDAAGVTLCPRDDILCKRQRGPGERHDRDQYARSDSADKVDQKMILRKVMVGRENGKRRSVVADQRRGNGTC